MLQMLQKLCEYHDLSIANDPELELLKSPTEPEALVKELKESLPENC
jgi:sugar/nucleoside kinase (ribokinase family)